MMMKKYVLFLIFAIMCAVNGYSQDFSFMKQNLDWQVYNYPQEKIHVMTDKPYYITGDTVWLRAFVVDAATHQPVDASKFVYVELISPMNEVSMRIKIKERDGVFKGYLPLNPTKVAEGEYTLTAYTMFMQNQGEQYFFKKKVKITSSFAIKRKIDYELEWKNRGEDNESMKIKLRYLDTETGEPCPYNSFSYKLPSGKVVEWKGGNRNLSIEIDHKDLRDGAVFVKYGNYGKYITFPSSSSMTYDVSFYPEGGYLVPGFVNRMTFKAMDSNGKPVDITGDIVDSSGNKVASITTTHDGMGLVTFNPQAGIIYRAVCQNDDLGEKTFDLPQVRSDATVLQVRQENETVKIEAKGGQQSTAMIAVQQRGRLLATGYGSVTIATDTLPAGVIQALLMNENGRMLSERLFFVTGKHVPNTKLTSDKSSYDSRELVQASVDLSEFVNAAGNFAVSVTDDRTIAPDSTTSILTNLLLQSDLQGRINNPGWYFVTPNRLAELDLLMMTQGWRRYDVPHALLGKILAPQYPIEKGQTLSGTVRTEWRKKLMKNAMIKVIAPRIGYANVVTSDENGRWEINNVVFPDSTKFIIQAANKKGSTLSNLKIDQDVFPTQAPLAFSREIIRPWDEESRLTISYISNEKNRLQYVDGVASVLLDEVVVQSYRRKKALSIYELVATHSRDYQFFEKRGISDFETALRYFAGIVVTPNSLYSTRDRGELIGILVDGIPLEGMRIPDIAGFTYSLGQDGEANLMNSSSDDSFRLLKELYPFDVVKQIDFIRGAEALAFGGGNYKGGIIAITTKDGTEMKKGRPDETIKTFIPLGFQRPAEFYAPRYDTGNGGMGEGTDLRETIYWNPSITIGSNRLARFNFYTGDAPRTNYTITVEGVTTTGEIIHAVKRIEKK